MKKSHLWMMLLCCLIPLGGLIAIYFFNIPLKSILFYGMVLLCPLSHLLMMKFMGHERSSAEQSQYQQHSNSASPPAQEK